MTRSILKPFIAALILATSIPQMVQAGGVLSFPSTQWPKEGAFPTRIPVELPTQTTTLGSQND